MSNYTYSQNNQQPSLKVDEVLKATSLCYLRDALFKEQYEQCPELIATAKGYGAQAIEIQAVLDEYVQEKQGFSTPKGSSRF